MKTEFNDLDSLINLDNGNLIIVGARPSMGKSSFVLNVAKNVAKNPKQIENINLIPQGISFPKIESANMIISKKCYDRAKEIYGEEILEDVKERLELEIQAIENNNFDSIYLILSELVKYSNELGYEVGFRGSVGNSFVAYLLGITNINPLQYNLPFELFAGINYDREPDIVLNFSEKIRDEIFKYLQEHIKTHNDYHAIDDTRLYRFDILENNDLTMLYELEKETNISSRNIKLDDIETLEMILHTNDINTNGIPEFENTAVKKMIEIAKPCNFNDLVCIFALSHGTGTWEDNASVLIESEHKKINEVISNRADMYNYLLNSGVEKNTAFDIVEFVRKGKANKEQLKYNESKYKERCEKWKEYKEILQKHNIPYWYIKSAEKINYLFPKSHSVEYTVNAFKIAWYKVHYPKAFDKVYFKLNETK